MATLTNITRATYQRDRARPDEKLHVIYSTAESLDYCREDAPASVATYAQAIDWAQRHFDRIADGTARRAVTAFSVEWW